MYTCTVYTTVVDHVDIAIYGSSSRLVRYHGRIDLLRNKY